MYYIAVRAQVTEDVSGFSGEKSDKIVARKRSATPGCLKF
jgi:hypothetical protein